MKQVKGVMPIGVFVLVLTIIFMMSPAISKAEDTACIAGAKIDQSIASEATLEEFSCFFKKFEGAEVVHFKVAVKKSERQTPAVQSSYLFGKR